MQPLGPKTGRRPARSLALFRNYALGSPKVINFTRAFDSAWERMSIILFRPFDLGKWFVMGFGAFLAGFLSGGNGFNSYNQSSGNNNGHPFSLTGQQPTQNFNNEVSRLVTSLQSFPTDVIILFVALIFVFAIAFVVLLY